VYAGLAGSTFIKPGSRNVAGEMLWEAVIPLQPVTATIKVSPKAKLNILVFNLTDCTV
jgi:hypothetical protein